jgi:hypothetical protein
MIDLNRTINWIGTGGFLGFLIGTYACAISTGSNLSFLAGIMFGLPIGLIAGAVGAAAWKRKHRD